jgi:tetratricopeptide (TPR) repeat protein
MPLNQTLHEYARFLIGQKDRLADAGLAIDRYRESLVLTQGIETRAMEQVHQLRLDLSRAKGVPEETAKWAEELLEFEESLSGTTSMPYLQAVQTAAGAFQSIGKTDRAVALHRQAVAVADQSLPSTDAQRGMVRMNAALALAVAGQFDEAERLAQEAMALGQAMRPPRADMFRGQAEQILRMKAAAESGAPSRGPNGAIIVTPSGQWFVRGGKAVSPANPDPPRP